jgi:acyl-CoA synthetase (NDP forming)
VGLTEFGVTLKLLSDELDDDDLPAGDRAEPKARGRRRQNPEPDLKDRPGLDQLMRPRSVAVIGASNDPARVPGLTIAYLKGAGFAGEIWPVNPTRETVQGLKAYPSVASLPGVPDVAVIVVPFPLVQQAIEDCAARGVKAAIVFTTGYGEADAEGARAERKLVQTARAAGMRLLGPNCLGCFNSELAFYGTFAIALAKGFARPGNLAVVSQSGAYGEQICYLMRNRGLGVRYFISTGNEADIDLGEVISWLADQPEIDVIVAYAEGARNPARLMAALRKAQEADKQVVFMKVGRSNAGAAAAASHTASLAGDDRVWDAVFQKYGVFRAESAEEQIDIAYAAARRIFPKGRSVGILTVSGGFGIHLCDAAEHHGLDVPPLPKATAERLHEILPFGSISNPVDASGRIVERLDRLGECLDLLGGKSGYDSVLAFFGTVAIAPAMSKPLFEAVAGAAEGLTDRLIILSLIAEDEVVRAYEAAGYLVFPDAHRASRALAGLVKLAEGRARRHRPIALPGPAEIGVGPLSEHASKALLAAAGVPVLPDRLVRSSEAAAEAGAELGYPVALKICSPAIPHKTEIGGVLLDVADAAAAHAGYSELMTRAAAAGYAQDAVEGVIVAPMAPKGVEAILGVQVDPTFGPAVMFGLGGTYVEVFKDVALRLAPIDEDEAHAMMREVRAWPIFEGARGERPADIDALAKALCALSRFAAANADRLSSIDVNPFVVWPEGQGGAALDALVTPAAPADDGA